MTPLDYHNTITVFDEATSTTPRHEMEFTKWNLGWREGEEATYNSPKKVNIRFKQVESGGIGKGKAPSQAKRLYSVQQESGKVTIGGSNLYYQNGRKAPGHRKMCPIAVRFPLQ